MVDEDVGTCFAGKCFAVHLFMGVIIFVVYAIYCTTYAYCNNFASSSVSHSADTFPAGEGLASRLWRDGTPQGKAWHLARGEMGPRRGRLVSHPVGALIAPRR